MKSCDYCQVYAAFQEELEQLRSVLTAEELKLPELQQIWQRVQAIFQNQVMQLCGRDLEPITFSSWQSVQTEIHREMRLLSTELMFLQLHRRKQKGVRDRLDKIIGFCQMLQ